MSELSYIHYEPARQAVFSLMERYSESKGLHPQRVQSLSAILRAGLAEYYPSDPEQDFILFSAALLHDIGQYYGEKKHHKNSMKMILDASLPEIDCRVQGLIALVARYHRRSIPEDSDEMYSQLSLADRWLVNIHAGLLRVADALDRSQCGNVTHLTAVMVDRNTLQLTCVTKGDPSLELEAVRKKSDLLASLCGINTVVIV